jgi:hypothetical protein
MFAMAEDAALVLLTPPPVTLVIVEFDERFCVFTDTWSVELGPT